MTTMTMIVTIMVMMVMNSKRRMIKNGRDCLLVLTPVGDDYNDDNGDDNGDDDNEDDE